MTGLALVILSARLLPLRDADDLAIRHDVAAAILAVTDDEVEQRALLVTAVEESHMRADVLDCRVRGDNGRARSAWQVHPRSREETEALCSSLVEGAAIALDRIRESVRACGRGPGAYALYASGSCSRGTRISARRWRLAMGVM